MDEAHLQHLQCLPKRPVCSVSAKVRSAFLACPCSFGNMGHFHGYGMGGMGGAFGMGGAPGIRIFSMGGIPGMDFGMAGGGSRG